MQDQPAELLTTSDRHLSRKQWFLVLLINFIFLLISRFIEQHLNHSMMDAMKTESSSFIFVAFGLFLNGLFFTWVATGALVSLVVPRPLESALLGPMLLEKWNDFSKEWLRSIGNASLWFFAFIVPGLLRWVDYLLLPFVCFLDPEYEKGEADALEKCRKTASMVRGRLWLFFILFALLIPLIQSSYWGDDQTFALAPWRSTLVVAFDACVQSLAFFILWRLYLGARPKS